METCCDLQVDVNGEETFLVNKKIISSFSGRLSKLFAKSKSTVNNFKVIFHDFPGGGENFELISRFCYNNGIIEINPSNIAHLNCAAHFMEMNGSVSRGHNLLEQTEKSLEQISYWTWSELLVALRKCQDLLPVANSTGIVRKCLDSLIGRVALASGSEASSYPSSSSPDSSGFRISCDTRSTESLKNSYNRVTWWFEDLLVLNPNLVEMVVKSMISRKYDNAIITRFLFYYQKSKFATATSCEKRKITESVVDLLCCLDQSSVPCKSLFGILRVALSLNISKGCRNKLESMIGSQMDQATLDNLLVPSPHGSNYLYDVNLVLRFLKAFLSKGISKISVICLRRVASLMDLYIAEVAPDPSLRPSKFVALTAALPDAARESYDGMYRAMDMYLEVHAALPEEEKMKICCTLNYDKLSSEVCMHLAQNMKFPSKTAVQALVSQQSKLKSLLQETNHSRSFTDSPCSTSSNGSRGAKDGSQEQIVLYAGKPDLSADNEKLRAHLKGMQWRVMELEKACRKMQTQMAKLMKSKPPAITMPCPCPSSVHDGSFAQLFGFIFPHMYRMRKRFCVCNNFLFFSTELKLIQNGFLEKDLTYWLYRYRGRKQCVLLHINSILCILSAAVVIFFA